MLRETAINFTQNRKWPFNFVQIGWNFSYDFLSKINRFESRQDFYNFSPAFDLSHRGEHFGISGFIHTLAKRIKKMGQSEAWKWKILARLKSIYFWWKSHSRNFSQFKGTFTILTKVDRRAAASLTKKSKITCMDVMYFWKIQMSYFQTKAEKVLCSFAYCELTTPTPSSNCDENKT